MSVETVPFPPLDPTTPQILISVGRKKSGKSEAARAFFRAWPDIDRLVIDVTGDADPGDDMNTITLHTLPERLPERPDDKRHIPQTFRWIANPIAETFKDDCDRAIGLGLFPKEREVLVWVDEAGEVFKVGQVGPHGRAALHQNRHFKIPLLLCCPRAKGIDTLCLAQADRILMFDVPSRMDRERLAETIGIPLDKLERELDETARRGLHWFTMYDVATRALYRCPPMPRN